MNRDTEQVDVASPLVSVVVPTCNRLDVFRRCLAALASQTYPNYEVIVVDDCSWDDTPQFLAQFASEHPDMALRVLRNESHTGANPSRNCGIREAKGAFVAFADSDCIAEPDWIEKLMAGFASERVAAVTGLIRDLPPGNVYELTFKGTHRAAGPGPARRLSAGNMCVRRHLLIEHALDEDRGPQAMDRDGKPDIEVSGRGDEEGLFLLLRAAGYEQRVVPEAVVMHEHRYSARSFFRQAFRGGGSAARLVYKYYLPPRLDLLPFILAYFTLPLVMWRPLFGLVPLFFMATALAAITYNDIFRKGKTIAETIRSFPVLLAYYHVRLAGYVLTAIGLRLGIKRILRVRLPSPTG